MIQNALNSGEITPLVHGRFDLSIYSSAVARMQNFRAMLHGGATRDPGIEALGFSHQNQKPYLLEFEFSTTQRFILEFTNLKLRFWTTGENPAPLDLVLDTPYTLAELQQVTFARINDLIYFADGVHPPQLLSRIAADVFTFEEMEFIFHPLADQSLDPNLVLTADITRDTSEWLISTEYAVGDYVSFGSNIYLCNFAHTSDSTNNPDQQPTYRSTTAGNRGGTNGIITNNPIWQLAGLATAAPTGTTLPLLSSIDFFDESSIGEVIELAFRRTVNQRRARVAIPANDSIISDYIEVDGDFTVTTTGNWTGTILVEESFDLGLNWQDILTYESDADANFVETHTTSAAVLLRINITTTAGRANNPQATITVSDPFTRAAVRITDVTDPRTATIIALQTVREREASFFSRSSFSPSKGYPSAVTIFRQRLIFGGTDAEKQKIWASAIDQYDNFRRQELADESTDEDQSFSFNVITADRIVWLASQKDLIAGTASGEFVVAGDQQTGRFAAGLFQIIPLSYNGCEPIRPIESPNGLIYIERNARTIHHIGTLADIAITPPDLAEISLYGEHLTRKGIVSHTYQRRPEPIYWCCDREGTLHGYTHLPSQRVLAWHTHPLGENTKVVSVASTYSALEEDQLFLALEHITEEGSTYSIARFATGQREAQESADSAAFRYLHHHTATVVTPEAFATSTDFTTPAIPHLAGQRLTISLDGNALARDLDPTVENTISLPFPGTVVYGIPYSSEIETLPPVLQTSNGPLGFLKQSQLARTFILPWKSATARLLHSGNSRPQELISRDPTASFSQPQDLESNPIQVDGTGSSDDRPTLTIIADDPLPFTLLSINYDKAPRQN